MDWDVHEKIRTDCPPVMTAVPFSPPLLKLQSDVCCISLSRELHLEFSSSVFLNFSLYYEVYVLRLIL